MINDNDFKDMATEQAESLRKTIETVIDDDVFMYQHYNVHGTSKKIVDYNCNDAEPLSMVSDTWIGLYEQLKAAEDAITFVLTAPIQD